MDRDAMARNQRRTQVEDALEEERGREAALAAQLEAIVAEADGPRLDEQVFERLDPDDVAVLREALQTEPSFEDGEEDGADTFSLAVDGGALGEDDTDEEIARLQDEIADSRRRQLAYRRYLVALDG